MTPDLDVLLSAVDPAVVGARIRAARETAALPAGELCRATGVDEAALADLEDGRRPLAPAFVTAVADHTDTTVEMLATGLSRDVLTVLQGELDHARLALSGQDSSDACAVADRVLEQLRSARATAPHLERDARRLRATAREASGDLAAAVTDLHVITTTPRRDPQWLKDLIALCRCYRESGQLDTAIAVGESATPMIRDLGLQGVTEAIQLTVTVASAYIFRAATGDIGHATRLCLRAADDADLYELPIAKASALWNASVAKYVGGDIAASLSLGQQALALYGDQGDIRNLGVLHMQMANAYLAQDPPDATAALEMLRLAGAELTMAGASAVELARHRQVLARAHLELGDVDAAHDLLAESDALAPDDAVELRAWHFTLLGTLAARRRDFREAYTHLEHAVRMLTASGADGDAAQVWFRVASVFAELGEMKMAADAYRRAAVSQGLRPTI
ncbi:helix-turn-helix domain-containing protein [Nocardioides sp. WV_118_6]